MGEQVAARFKKGGLAQLGEHLPCKQGVESSNLLVSTAGVTGSSSHGCGGCGGTLKTEYRNQNNQVSKTSTACRGKKTEAEKIEKAGNSRKDISRKQPAVPR